MTTENRLMERLIDLKKKLEQNNESFMRHLAPLKEKSTLLEFKVTKLEESLNSLKELLRNPYTDAIVSRMEKTEETTEKTTTDLNLLKKVLQDNKMQYQELKDSLQQINQRIDSLEQRINKLNQIGAERINERITKLEKVFDRDEMQEGIKKLRSE